MDEILKISLFAANIVFIFGLIIIVHEAGHLVAAKACGVGVKSFSFGFGPVLCRKTWGETEYRISLLPFGGYVSLVGESGDDAEFPENTWFNNKPISRKSAIVSAGVAANFLFAFLSMISIALFQSHVRHEPIIGSVLQGGPAEQAGLKTGFRITSAAGIPIGTSEEFSIVMLENGLRPLSIGFSRPDGTSGSTLSLPTYVVNESPIGDEMRTPGVGISFGGKAVPYDPEFAERIGMGIANFGLTVRYTVAGLWKAATSLVKGVSGDRQSSQWLERSISGPLGIGKTIWDSTGNGLRISLLIASILSINIGIFNLLPIPILDGGMLAGYAIEKTLGEKTTLAYRKYGVRAGAVMLIALLLTATWLDIQKIFAG